MADELRLQSPTRFPDWFSLSADALERFSPSHTISSHGGD